MIYTEIKGRLGNQLFKYAYTRAVQLQRGDRDELVFSFNNMNGKSASDGWEDSLKYFSVVPYSIYNKKGHLVINEGDPLQRALALLFYLNLYITSGKDRKKRSECNAVWQPRMDKYGLNIMLEHYYPFKSDYRGSIFIDGTFQDSKYFNNIREELIKELTPKFPPLEHNRDLYKIINNTNSVCVSIRRGDYVTNKEFSKTYNICTAEYFQKAAYEIEKRVNDPVFILFSDDINWVKQNVKLGDVDYFEDGSDPVWEKLRLMYSCKHFIISNSTFSWWAQYLSRNSERIVVSPSMWERGGFDSNLIEDWFIKVNV